VPPGGLSSDPSVVLTGDGNPSGIPAGMTVNDTIGDILHRFGSVNRSLDLQTAGPTGPVEQGIFEGSRSTTYTESGFPHTEANNNGHILAMCDEAKRPVLDSNGQILKEDRITVFTISFFAPPAAQTLMEQCASIPRLHYTVQNLNIDSAFQAIAKTINQLRLTQ
jgi:hypothetical protein